MSVFQFQDGAAQPIAVKLANNSATAIVDTTNATAGGAINVASFRVSENTGAATPNVTVTLYDTVNVVSYYLGSAGVTYNAKAFTAGQSVLFDDGYAVPNGWQIRVQSSDAAGKLDVTGIKISKARTARA